MQRDLIMITELLDRFLDFLMPKNQKKSMSYNTPQKRNIKYSTSAVELKNVNVVHNENQTEQEIEALYDEIRTLQEKNRNRIQKNKFACRIK